MGWHVACVGEWRVLYRVLVVETEGKLSHARPKHRWEIVVKTDYQGV